ncbi:MAG: enoyl-CoA hydratase/isomerase family protein [Burkholderiales bacterium]
METIASEAKANLIAALAAAGLPGAEATALAAESPTLTGDFDADRARFSVYWRRSRSLFERLPAKPRRDPDSARAAEALQQAARGARTAFAEAHIETIYRRLTAELTRHVRAENLIYDAAELVPGLVPTRADVEVELTKRQADKEGVEVDQGLIFSRLMAKEFAALHLLHSMMLPLPDSLARAADFARTGRADFGRAWVERKGDVSTVTIANIEALNAEDWTTITPMETAIDLALLDAATKVCVLRGAPVKHPKFAGKRLFGAGLNLTDLYWGRIPFLFYVVRDMGLVNKMYRGLTSAGDSADETLAASHEKLWIAAVEEFAIGGHCQILLCMDYIVAERHAYATLPARKEGIIPGMANMRLPRFVGDRIARQAIQYGRRIDFDTPEGRMIADELVEPGDMDRALMTVATGLTSSGVVGAIGNRKAFRIVQEPLALMARYLAVYFREQAHCLESPALIDNLERFWDAANRRPKG